MVSEERQQIIETNRSLRLIKNELETLLEKGIINEDAFDTISTLLPAESSLSSTTPAPRAQPAFAAPSPAPRAPSTVPTPAASIPPQPQAQQQQQHPAPPSYAQSTTGGGPPPLPGRNQPPAPAPPSKPVLARARALYKYTASDARDCSFDRDDHIAVYEYMNDDWWMGKNERTGQEGIFPKSYVQVEPAGLDEKRAGGYPGAVAPGPYGNGYPTAGNPYNAGAPPMAMANQDPNAQQQQEEGGSKMGEHGKKFGKKLGNAAIFGAGATIGSNLVNSIF